MPQADYVCNSKKCRKPNGTAPVYELPTKATHCPYGHRQIVRLYNKINVNLGARPAERYDGRHTSSSMAARVDAIAERPYEEAQQKGDVLKRASQERIKQLREGTPLVHVVPSARLAQTMATVFPNAPLATPAPQGKAHKSMGELSGPVGQVPSMTKSTEVVAKDTEHRLGKKGDGTLEIRKA